MIAILISTATSLAKAAIAPIIYVWDLITQLWENSNNKWED